MYNYTLESPVQPRLFQKGQSETLFFFFVWIFFTPEKCESLTAGP